MDDHWNRDIAKLQKDWDDHHDKLKWNYDPRETRDREDAWAATEVGKLFYAYERLREQAWIKDTELSFEDPPAAKHIFNTGARERWAKADEARAAFLAAIRELG